MLTLSLLLVLAALICLIGSLSGGRAPLWLAVLLLILERLLNLLPLR